MSMPSRPKRVVREITTVEPAFKRGRFNSAAKTIQRTFKTYRNNKNRLFQTSSSFPEKKYFSTVSGGAALSMTYSPQFTLLNPVPTGTDAQTRTGREIINCSVQLRATWGAQPSVLNTWEALNIGVRMVRWILFYDKQSNAVAPTVDQLLDLGSGSSVGFVVASRNQDYIERFDVLFDEKYVLPSAGPNGGEFDRYVKCALRTKFIGTAGAISSIEAGALWLMQVDNNGSGVGYTSCTWHAKVMFTDV